jgi:hydroxyacylglutathione hydrolase
MNTACQAACYNGHGVIRQMNKFHSYPLGPLQTNCYIAEADTGECLIFDPGEEAGKLADEIEKLQLRPVAIYLTHAHFDHIGAVEAIRTRFGIPVHLHPEEQEWLTDPLLNGSGRYADLPDIRTAAPDRLIEEDSERTEGPFRFRTLHVPGHSPGSVAFYFEREGTLVGGDALFRMSIGRTDLPGGDHETLLNSIREKLLTLPADTTVLPGHMGPTTIGEEKRMNPFLSGM